MPSRAPRPQQSARSAARQAAAEGARRRAEQARRRRLLAWVGGGVAVVAVAAGATAIAFTAAPATSPGMDAPMTTIPVAPSAAADATTRGPWAAPSDPSARARAAGLTMLQAEGTVEHIHSHLGITIDGTAVPVPAGIGIDEQQGAISPLHTHDATGIVHVESPVKTTFTLGQVFTEWGVALGAGRIGGYGADAGDAVAVFVDGKKVDGDPAAIQLADHADIEIVVTRAGQTVTAPAAFSWPGGY